MTSNFRRKTKKIELDDAIFDLLQQGLPICERPFKGLSQSLGVSEADIILRARHLLKHLQFNKQRPQTASARRHRQSFIREIPNSQPLSGRDQHLLNLLHRGLQLAPTPFQFVATALEMSLDEVLFRCKRLQQQKHISKITLAI